MEKEELNTNENEYVSEKLFGRYYNLLLNTTYHQFHDFCQKNGIGIPEWDNTLISAYISQLQTISIRTLILEMQLAEQCGELNGKNSVEKYMDFSERMLCSEEFLGELYLVYPELRHEIDRTTKCMLQNLISLIRCFQKDLEDLNKKFFSNQPCQTIVRIGGGDSDSHRGGKRIYWVQLDNGKRLIYKPRSLAIDAVFYSMLEWLFKKVNINYQWYQILDCGEYGWCEWIELKACQTRTELSRYYYRNGILLGLAYLLGMEDMHYENMVAAGEYPVFIDLEMAVGGRGIDRKVDEQDETLRIYQESVLQTGILPLYAWTENGEGINVSALSGRGNELMPVFRPVIIEAGTVNMHIEYRKPRTKAGRNLATINGIFIEPYEFINEIEEGFLLAGRVFLFNRKEVRKYLEKFCNVPVRFLLRDTQQYSMMISASYFPEMMTAFTKRQEFFQRVIRKNMSCEREKIWAYEQEEKAMEKGDIPYFWYYPREKTLRSGTGSQCGEYFKVTALEKMMQRLEQLDDRELLRQKKLIHSALFIGTKGKKKYVKNFSKDLSNNTNICTKELRVKLAEEIGNKILDEAIWAKNQTDVGWISMIMAGYKETGYLMRPMNLYLYDGLPGVALFLAELARSSGEMAYCRPVRPIIKKMFDYTEAIQNKETSKLLTGGFSGESSIVYAYLLFYELSRDKVFLHYAKNHAQAIVPHLLRDECFDLVSGNAGAILVMLKGYALTGDTEYLKWAKMAGDYLLTMGVQESDKISWRNLHIQKALTGLAHGASGFVLAFAKLAGYTGEQKYVETAEKVLSFETQYYMPDRKEWKDLRYEGKQQEADSEISWCYGRGGILAAYHVSQKYLPDSLQKKMKRIEREVLEWCPKVQHRKTACCLCHGEVGGAALLNALNCSEAAERKMNQTVAGLMKQNTEVWDILSVQECENMGLIAGISGIGYGCLKGTKGTANLLLIADETKKE